MTTTRGKPLVTTSVLRTDARARPVAKEPSAHTARGFPIGPHSIHCNPKGPEPRAGTGSLLQPVTHRVTSKPCRSRIRTVGTPTRLEARTTARARFNSGLQP